MSALAVAAAPWAAGLLWTLALAACWAARAELRKAAASWASSRHWAAAAVLAALGLAFRLIQEPEHRVFLDEHEHFLLAARLAASGVFAQTLASGPGLDVLSPAAWPAGWHVLAAVAMKAFGEAWPVVIALNTSAGALTVLPAFALGAALAGPGAGLAAAAAAAFSPLSAAFSRTGDIGVLSAGAAGAALLAWTVFAGRPGRRTALAAGLLTAAALQCRLELAFLLLPAAAALAGLRGAKESRTAWAACSLGLAASTFLICLNVKRGLYGFGPDTNALTLAGHLPANVRFFMGLEWGRAALFPVLLLGAASSWKSPLGRALLVFSAAGFALYGAYPQGDLTRSDSCRYALVLDAALLPLAGAGAAALWRLPLGRPAAALVLAAYLFAPRGPRPGAVLSDTAALLEGAGRFLPAETYVAGFSPSYVASVSGRPSVWAPLLVDDSRVLERVDEGGRGLAVLKDHWWAVSSEGDRVEAFLRRRYAWSPAGESGSAKLHLLTPLSGGRPALRGR